MIGNTRWHWAILKNHEWEFQDTSPDTNKLIKKKAFLRSWAAVGSVPISKILNPTLQINLKDVPLINQPSWLGIDRSLAAWQALQDKSLSDFNVNGFLIVDAGTILSMTRVTKQGAFAGGLLAPGFQVQLNSMNNSAMNLFNPESMEIPKEPFPTSTASAMLKGSFNTLLGAILEAYKAQNVPIIICGGDATILYKELKSRGIHIIHRPNLVLEGMIRLLDIQRNA